MLLNSPNAAKLDAINDPPTWFYHAASKLQPISLPSFQLSPDERREGCFSAKFCFLLFICHWIYINKLLVFYFQQLSKNVCVSVQISFRLINMCNKSNFNKGASHLQTSIVYFSCIFSFNLVSIIVLYTVL